MSLALTALRLQAIAALLAHPTIAATCEGRVFDSRIGDLDHSEPVPVIVVTTEALEGDAFDPQNGGAPFDDACRLVLEIGSRQVTTLAAEGEEEPEAVIFTPATDRETEANLDLISWAAEQVLTTGRIHPAAPQMIPEGALLLRAVTRRVNKRTSERFSSDETSERLAVRLVTFEVELKGEDVDMANRPTGPFASLPEPLRMVCEAAPEDSSAGFVCRLIAQQITAPDGRLLSKIGIETDGLGLPPEEVALTGEQQ